MIAAATSSAVAVLPRRPVAPASTTSTPMISARTTGGDGPMSIVYATTAAIESSRPRRRPANQPKSIVANADTYTTFDPETTTRCDVFVVLRSADRSGGSAERCPSSTPCASDACGSGSERASDRDSVRRTCSTVAWTMLSPSCPMARADGYSIVLWMPRRAR